MKKISSHIDELSGVYNRRYLKEKQEETIEAFVENNAPFSVVMVDIDHFKAINDTYGHLKGDQIIKEFARFLKDELRKTDTVIRYGGDEFICVMPEVIRQDAEWIYRRILERCKARDFGGLTITLSAGIASFPDDGRDFETLLKVADQVLYDAKRSGRDRIGLIRKKKIILPMRAFIDRIEEKEELKRLITNNGQMRVVVVKGNVGIGKTRLSKQILSNVKGREVIWSDCLYLAEGIAYYPIREALQYHIKRWGSDGFKKMPLVYKVEIGKLLPEFAEELVSRPDGVEVVLDKYRLYESIRLVMAMGEQDKIVVVDNIQWIDRESMEVMKYLMRSLKANPITFVFIYRIEEVTDALEEFLSYISREVSVTDIIVKPFKQLDIKESVKSIIGEEPDKHLVEYVVRESGGIPFYIEEIMQGLVDERYLTVEEDSWIFIEPEKELVPKSIEDIAVRKYRTLSKEAQQVVDAASVIGWFDIGILMDITGYNEGEIIGFINHMNKLGLIKYKKERYEFDEEISRQALYQKNVVGIRRMELHRKLGAKLEDQNRGKEGELVEMLAYHYYHGQESEKGVRYCMEAADKAKEAYANQYAIRYYSWAIELLKDAQDTENVRRQIDCLYKRAEVLSLIGNNEASLRDLEDGLKKSLAIVDKKRAADTMLRKAGIHHRISQYRNAIADAAKSMEIYQEIGDRAQEAYSRASIGYAHWSLSENKQAMESYEEAMRIFRELGEKKGEATTLNSFGTLYLGIDFERALRYYEDALKLYREIDSQVGASRVCNNIGILYNQLGKYQSALDYLMQALKMETERGSKHGEETIYVNMGNIYSALDKNYDAMKYYASALKIARQTGNKESEGICLNNIGLKYDTLGEYHKALKFLEEATAITRDIGDKRTEAAALTGQGQVHQHLGEYQKAKAFYDQAMQIGYEQNVVWVKFGTLISQGEFYLLLNEHEKAKKYIDAAYELSKEVVARSYMATTLGLMCDYYLQTEHLEEFERTIKKLDEYSEIRTEGQNAAIALMLGRYYIMVKDYDAADRQLRRSLEVFKKAGNKLEVGKAYYFRGMMEQARGSPSGAKENIRESVKVLEALGANGWKEKAEAFYENIQ